MAEPARIGVLGGGPAGLYFALLCRQALPLSAVTVWERNRADDTYGFGVVFSDETLGAFRDADGESFARIAARFRRWEAIATYYRGTCTVSRGHGFAALSRGALLGILQERCRALGVELRFEAEIGSLADLAAHERCDLLVAADGVNSMARRELAEELQPRVEQGRSRFCWLGTSRPLDAFTFLFRETAHGLFVVHAYPYDDGMCTWIVECSEATWRNAGLDATDEAGTVARCAEIFADFLAGHPLVANRSIWRTFPTVSCAHWSAPLAGAGAPVVLLGDAAHTAHFSIGSGTKLAMEDAIALVAALGATGAGDAAAIATALRAYDDTRRVDVAKLQKAARTSREWFEAAVDGRYLGQHPLQLTFNMMTRSKRITYENLAARDPALVGAVDRWYRQADGAPVETRWEDDGHSCLGPGDVAWRVDGGGTRRVDGLAAAATDSPHPHPHPHPPMLLPFRVRGLELQNRIVVSPMCQYSASDGTVGDWHLVHLGGRALGGAGLVIAEMTDVEPAGRITHGCAGMYRREHVDAWRRIVDFVHAHSVAKIGLQLAHAGRKGSVHHPWVGPDRPLLVAEGAWETIGPSAIPFYPDWPPPRQMTDDDMQRVGAEFVRAARWADEAGFDWLELHMAHGYLLSSFLSPLANRREDEHGGSLENRMRFPLAVFAAVRAAWPAAKPMSVRITGSDWMDDGSGITPEEATAFARELKAHGCDVVDVSSGGNSPLSRPEYGRMYQVPFAEQVRFGAGVPVMTVGALLGADHANTVLAAGRADLAVMARPHLADPYLTAHAAAHYGSEEYAWPGQYELGRPRG